MHIDLSNVNTYSYPIVVFLNDCITYSNTFQPSLFRLRVDLKRSVYVDGVNIGLDLLEVTSENSFFLHKVFRDPPESPNISKSLPPINGSRIDGPLLFDLAVHFIRVYASLWSSPSVMIRTNAERVIKDHMSHDMSYVSVHKVCD